MKIISHRGNLNGPNPNTENSFDAINRALDEGFYVEVDVWFKDNKWFLGHEFPTYRFNIFEFSEVNDKLIYHCKNFEALEQLNGSKKIRHFWHQKDFVTLLSDGTPWTYPGYVIKNGIACDPSMRTFYPSYKIAQGICTDYPIDLRESLPIYY